MGAGEEGEGGRRDVRIVPATAAAGAGAVAVCGVGGGVVAVSLGAVDVGVGGAGQVTALFGPPEAELAMAHLEGVIGSGAGSGTGRGGGRCQQLTASAWGRRRR